MNSSGADGWRGGPGGSQANHPSMEHPGQPPLRQLGGFGYVLPFKAMSYLCRYTRFTPLN